MVNIKKSQFYRELIFFIYLGNKSFDCFYDANCENQIMKSKVCRCAIVTIHTFI